MADGWYTTDPVVDMEGGHHRLNSWGQMGAPAGHLALVGLFITLQYLGLVETGKKLQIPRLRKFCVCKNYLSDNQDGLRKMFLRSFKAL